MTVSHALLLTDLVDSTLLTQQLGDTATATLWQAHDRMARDLLAPFGGREIDKTDGMLLLFATVQQAVGYQQAYTQALSQLPLPLQSRAGLHRGPLLLRENSAEDVARGAKPLEVDGLVKPATGRVMSLAQGGQLLLTREAAQALEPLPPAGLRLHSHGHWELKGLGEPIEVFELVRDDQAPSAPIETDKARRVVLGSRGWVALRQVPHNLPQALSSFIGRERERQQIVEHLGQARLLTLLGMGGLGKTRLSIEVAEHLREQFADGVWFIDLSPIRDPALLAGETAQVLGLRDEPERPLIQTLCAYLKPRRVLLVLDNCEHLVQAAADLAQALLHAAPLLRILASSREALHLLGEFIFPVLPLPLPSPGAGAQALMQSPAVRLFVERARLLKTGFVLGEREAPAVAELVVRLEGIPLALELAAARVRTLSVPEINLRLGERYKLLTGGNRAAQGRQQTLRALVDWSYDLLSAAEQTLLQRLGVFVGGFDLAAAEAVCGTAPLSADELLDLLASLVDKSLVMVDEQTHGTRYRMLETLRDYAREKLALSGEAAATAERHCIHFFAVAKQAREGLKGADHGQWTVRVEADQDNLRSATALALAGGADPFIAVKMAVALQGFWILRGQATEGRSVVQAALALPEVQASDMAQAFALYVGAALADAQGDHAEARQKLQTCLALRRRLNVPVDIAATLSTLAQALLKDGDVAGAADCEREALQIFRQAGDEVGIAIGLVHLAECAMALGDDAQARNELAQGLVMAQRMGHGELEAECERLLGEMDFESADLSAAHAHFQRSLAISREAGNKRAEAHALRWQSRVHSQTGQHAAAAQGLGEALRAFRAFEMRDEWLACLEDHAQLLLLAGRGEAATRLAAFAHAEHQRLAGQRLPRAEQRWQLWLAALRDAVPAASFSAAWQTGLAADLESTLREAEAPL